MADTHELVVDIEHLNALERRIVEQIINRRRTSAGPPRESLSLGERIADRVTAFGGSWSFIFLTIVAIGAWMLVNAYATKAFDAYPYILLNLVLACMTVLQAPLIMMSQNRQASRDRIDARHDYEVNAKAEMEIAALHAKVDALLERLDAKPGR